MTNDVTPLDHDDDMPDLHAVADRLRRIAAQPAVDALDARHRAQLGVAAATVDALADDVHMSPLDDVHPEELDK